MNTFNIAAEELVNSFKQDGDFGEPRNVSHVPLKSV